MIFWIIWFIIGMAVVLLFAVYMLPRIMLRTHAAALPVRDKAIGRLPGGKDVGVSYVPADSVRPYIKQYTVASDGNGLYFRGEWACVKAFVDYELTVYDANNRIVDIFRIKEKFNGGRFTHVTRLPQTTDYVTLRIVYADDTPVIAERQPFRKQYALWLAALCLCLAATVDVLLWLGITFVFNCLDNFTMTNQLSVGTWAMLLGLTAVGVSLATCAFSLGGFLLRRKGYLHEKTQK